MLGILQQGPAAAFCRHGIGMVLLGPWRCRWAARSSSRMSTGGGSNCNASLITCIKDNTTQEALFEIYTLS
jgi:hypothetical protein